MRQVKSAEEFDILMAVHEVSCCHVNLNYGLISPMKIQRGENGKSGAIKFTEFKAPVALDEGPNSRCTLRKAYITVGTFFTPD